MIQVDEREQTRRAYFVEQQSVRRIARELGHSRPTIGKALTSAEPEPCRLKAASPAPHLGQFKAGMDELLAENQSLPRKQRYTARKIFEQLQSGGYAGSESHVRCYVAQQHQVRPGATATPGGGSPGS
jgi:hypothetical protein